MNSEFKITDSAAVKIDQLMKLAGSDKIFRISVMGGGCSGFQYDFSYQSEVQENDIVYSHKGICVYIDPTSNEFLKTATLNYIQDLGSAQFEIKNPLASSMCGCKKSFSI